MGRRPGERRQAETEEEMRVGEPDRSVEKFRRSDRFEAFMDALGWTFVAGGVVSAVALVFLLVTLGQADERFPGTAGFLTALRGVGIGFFAVSTVGAIAVGDFLLGGRIWKRVRRWFRR